MGNSSKGIKVFLEDKSKKSYLRIGKEIFNLWLTKKEIPYYYFKHLYKKSVNNYGDYIGTKEAARLHLSTKIHKPEFRPILRDKLLFALYCEKNDLSSPKLLGYNLGQNFIYSGKSISIQSLENLLDFYESFFEEDQHTSLFFRPLSLNGGRGCFKINKSNFKNKLTAEFSNLLKDSYTHTEVLTQHTELGKIHPSSINTIRILTYREENKKAVIISSFLRIGVGGNVVDNGSSGGIFVGINQHTGKLKKNAYRNFKFGGGELTEHPDTKVKFEDFSIPYFKEACKLVIKGTEYIPDHFIGWDIAITPSGPSIIEANDRPDLFMSDVSYGGLLQNPDMQRLIQSA